MAIVRKKDKTSKIQPAKDHRFRSAEQEKEARRRRDSRRIHPALVLSDEECLSHYGYIPFPGCHGDPTTDVDEWKARLWTEAQNSYPATGFAGKPFEAFDPLRFDKILDEELWKSVSRERNLVLDVLDQ